MKAGGEWNAVITSTLGMDPFLSQGQAALKAHSVGMLTISLFVFYFVSLSPTLVFSPSGVSDKNGSQIGNASAEKLSMLQN